jgi:hypothetical protein
MCPSTGKALFECRKVERVVFAMQVVVYLSKASALGKANSACSWTANWQMDEDGQVKKFTSVLETKLPSTI